MDNPGGGTLIVRKSGRTVTRAIAGETLIVPIAGGVADLEALFTLNPVGARIWALLERPTSEPQLVDTIVREFDVAPAEAAADITSFVGSLRAAGLIENVPG
jgi:hypothetical protein